MDLLSDARRVVLLSGYEILYFWNAFRQMPFDALRMAEQKAADTAAAIEAAAVPGEAAWLELVRHTIHSSMEDQLRGGHVSAELAPAAFTSSIKHLTLLGKADLGRYSWVAPFSMFELAGAAIQRHDDEDALLMLGRAKKDWTGYDFERRLHFLVTMCEKDIAASA